MKLFVSGASPFVRKVMVCADEIGLAGQIEVVEVAISPVAPNADLSAANPLGKIPTLVLDDGTALYDSRVITAYLDEVSGGRLLPASGPARWQALKLEATADGLTEAALLARYERALRPAELRWPDWDAGQVAKVERALDVLETTTLDPGQVTVGNVATACAVGYLDFRFPELAWRSRCPRLSAFETAFSARPSMQRTQPKG
jgi:glutathione S-transferase